jgi:hypothetical protein
MVLKSNRSKLFERIFNLSPKKYSFGMYKFVNYCDSSIKRSYIKFSINGYEIYEKKWNDSIWFYFQGISKEIKL